MTRYAPPSRSRAAETSPRLPPRMPVNISWRVKAGTAPSCRAAIGVAADTASTVLPRSSHCRTAGKLLMTAGKEKRKTRPARAGFMKFFPRPPKSCLTMTIAKKSPTSTTQ